MRDPRALDEPTTLTTSSHNGQAFNVEGAELTVRLRLTRLALQHLRDFAPRVLAETTDSWLSAEVDLLHAQTAVRLVQAAPGEVIVEGPSEAREAVHDWAMRALAGYDV